MMSVIDDYLDPEEYEDDVCCDYGLGICSDPETKERALCTTECDVYIDSLEETLKDEEMMRARMKVKQKIQQYMDAKECPLLAKCKTVNGKDCKGRDHRECHFFLHLIRDLQSKGFVK